MFLIKLCKWFTIQFRPKIKRNKRILSIEEIVYKIKQHDYISVDEDNLNEALTLSSKKIKARVNELDEQIQRSKDFNKHIDDILEIIIKKSEGLNLDDKSEIVRLLTEKYNDYLKK